MAPTSDERREVAARLRDIESIYGEQRHPFPETDFVLAIAKITGTPLDSTLKDLAFRLADLIDPTCHVVIPNEMDGECFCSECGALLGEYGYTAYCPNCGARVTRGGER